MIICGIDYSISSPAVVKAVLDDNYEINSIDYLSFSSVKKQCNSDKKLVYNNRKDFRHDMQRFQFLRDEVEKFIYSDNIIPSYIAMEGYAMGGMGKVFNIAEATALTKCMIFDRGTPLRIYTPSAIKKFATLSGDAGKVSMFKAFKEDESPFINLNHLEDMKNPQEDIIDAYWIMKLLLTELKLRSGMCELKSLNHKQIEVFNAVSKSNPQNILAREFIQKMEE